MFITLLIQNTRFRLNASLHFFECLLQKTSVCADENYLLFLIYFNPLHQFSIELHGLVDYQNEYLIQKYILFVKMQMQRIISMHFQASILIDLNGMINYDINISYRKHTYNLLRIHRILLLQSLPIVLIDFYGLVLCKMNISYRKLNSKSDNSLNAICCINFD